MSKQSSAATTAFCSARIDGPGGHHLWVDGNGKITAGNGTLDNPSPNAFSLVQIEDCPGSTPSCRASCYVHALERHAPDTHRLYRHNSLEVRAILTDGTLAAQWAAHMGAWIAENCAGGYRWHVSGDVFSLAYAEWIASVCGHSPGVTHWIYTRSFAFLDALAGVPNLVINLSCDRDNIAAAEEAAAQYGLRLCYLTQDGAVPSGVGAGDTIFPDYSLRANMDWFGTLTTGQKKAVCPVDFRGKSEVRRCGPCDRCMRQSDRAARLHAA